MEYIQIPAPDFLFQDMIRLKANKVIKTFMHPNNIAIPYGSNKNIIEDEIKSVLYELRDKKQRAFFINEIIIYTYTAREQFDKNKTFTKDKIRFEQDVAQHKENINKFNLLLLFLYNILSEDNFIIDNDLFTSEEAIAVNTKLDSIIKTLDVLKMEHEALGAEIQDVKDQLSSLNNSLPLGRKNLFQRATGIAVHLATDKSGEIIWDAIKPQISELLLHHIPKVVSELLLLKP